jgi:hypothetical protein
VNNASTLASINTAEEQEWVKNFVFVKHKTVDNVWIGGKRDNMTFVWEDGLKFSYTNWFDIKNLNKSGNDCIELMTDIGYSFESKAGKWAAIACQKRNLALCQLFQSWSLPHVQKILTEFRKEMKDFVQNANQNPGIYQFIDSDLYIFFNEVIEMIVNLFESFDHSSNKFHIRSAPVTTRAKNSVADCGLD